jgi:hypothetical protein
MVDTRPEPNKKSRCVEHCSTRGRELKRIINRAHGNSDHLKPFIKDDLYNPYVVCLNKDNVLSNVDVYKRNDIPNVSCAMLGGLYCRNSKDEGVKKSYFTENFMLFVNQFVTEVVLSEVAIIWLLYFIFAH